MLYSSRAPAHTIFFPHNRNIFEAVRSKEFSCLPPTFTRVASMTTGARRKLVGYTECFAKCFRTMRAVLTSTWELFRSHRRCLSTFLQKYIAPFESVMRLKVLCCPR